MSSSSSGLSLSSSVVLRAEPQYYGTWVAFDWVRVRTVFLEEDEFRALWFLYGRLAGVEEVAREAKMGLGRCVKFLRRALKMGLVKEGGQAVAVRVPRREEVDYSLFSGFAVPFLSAPASVDVFVTSRCNLRCVHCFSSTGGSLEVSFEELVGVFDQLEELGVLEVRINGGEPLMHADIERVLLDLGRRRFRKVLLTNGTLLTDSVALQLKRAGVTPTVSLDDSEAGGHDRFRGVAGAFERTLAGLKVLQRNGVEFGVNCCLHAKNLGKVKSVVGLVAGCGASRVSFLDLKPLGRMRMNEEWVPSYDKYEEAAAHVVLEKTKNRGLDVSLDAFLSCAVLSEMVREAKNGYITCEAGRTRFTVFSDGSVYPCNTVVGDPKWNMGNLRTEKLRDIWFSSGWAFFRGGVKKNDLKQCRDCKNFKGCRDVYCRLIPYVARGDVSGPSLRCSPSVRSL